MTDPTPPTHDPITAILILVTEIKTQLAGVLPKVDEHARTLIDHGNRLTALETSDQRDVQNESRGYSSRAVFWAAASACAGFAALLLTLLFTKG